MATIEQVKLFILEICFEQIIATITLKRDKQYLSVQFCESNVEDINSIVNNIIEDAQNGFFYGIHEPHDLLNKVERDIYRERLFSYN